MSQRKPRQTSEEVMAARENMEAKLPDNVSVLPFASDMEAEEAEATKAFEESLKTIKEDTEIPSDEDFEKFMNEANSQPAEEPTEAPDEAAVAPTAEATEENLSTTENAQPKGFSVLCPCCGQVLFVEGDTPVSSEEANALAIKFCNCSGSKVIRQESEMNDEIDNSFGPESKDKYGIGHTPDELVILKLIGAYVTKRKVKGITIKLNGGDDAIFLIKKDATIVRHRRTIKAEAEV